MLLLLGGLSGTLIALASGGSLSRLSRVRFELEGLLLLLLAAEAMLMLLAQAIPQVLVVWIAIMFGLLLVALLNVRRVPEFWLLAAGNALNLLVIALNAGMPVSAEALQLAGKAPTHFAQRLDWLHVGLSAQTRLPFLADTVPLAPGLHVIASAGDMFLAIGIALVLVHAMLEPRSTP